MKFVKKAIRMAKKVYKSNKLTKILIFLSFVLIVMFVVKKERKEGFSQKKSFILQEGTMKKLLNFCKNIIYPIIII